MSVTSLHGISVGKKSVAPTNHFYDKHNPPAGMETQFWFWCAQDDEGGVILIDQGCNQEIVDEMKIPFQMKLGPQHMLEALEIRPEDVRHVILTHLHWDHFAGDFIYPNATYHVHEKELQHLTGKLMRFPLYSQHYYLPAAKKLLDLLYSGKLKVISDDAGKINEDVEYVRLGGHTPGLMAVVIKNKDKNYIICSDVLPRYQNLEECIACGIHYNVTEALEAQEKIKEIASTSETVLPGHDPLIVEKFPVVQEGIVKIF